MVKFNINIDINNLECMSYILVCFVSRVLFCVVWFCFLSVGYGDGCNRWVKRFGFGGLCWVVELCLGVFFEFELIC